MFGKFTLISLMMVSCASAFIYVNGHHRKIAYKIGLLEKPKMAR